VRCDAVSHDVVSHGASNDVVSHGASNDVVSHGASNKQTYEVPGACTNACSSCVVMGLFSSKSVAHVDPTRYENMLLCVLL